MRMRKGVKHVFADWCGVEAGYGTNWYYDPKNNIHKFMPVGVRIRIHKPVLETGPSIYPDKPWENGSIGAYATFLKDGGMYRVWYECFSYASTDDMTSTLAYAESDDGIIWHKPSLGIYEFNGSKNNNIIMAGHGCSVFKDEGASFSERYKMVWAEYISESSDGKWCNIRSATSPDGIKWNINPIPILTNPADTQTIVLYDKESNKYILYTRQTYDWQRNSPSSGRRSISRSVTDDFNNWPEPQMIMTNDPCDPPDWDYYTNGYSLWPETNSAHIMFISMYHRTTDMLDIHIAMSRDGKEWYRPLGREAWIPNGDFGTFNSTSIYAASGIVPIQDGKWCIHVHCNPYGHNMPFDRYKTPYGGLWRAVIREDGFVSIRADERGEFWTEPLVFEGSMLNINAVIPYQGYIKVGLVNADTGEEINGFETEVCDHFEGSILKRKVTWQGKSDLSGLSGKSVRLYFKMFKSDLFSFHFKDR